MAFCPYLCPLRVPARFDFGPENEHFAARLGRRTQGRRKGWVVGYRFATGIRDRDA